MRGEPLPLVRSFGARRSYAEIEAHQKAETQATYKLVYHFTDLREMFSAEHLNEYIVNAKALTYPEDSREELHQQQLIKIFNEMLAYLQTANHK